MNNFKINQLVELLDQNKNIKKVIRVLSFDFLQEKISVIDVLAKSGVLPVWIKLENLSEMIETGQAQLAEPTGFATVPFSLDLLDSPKFITFREKRDVSWSIIEPLVTGENALLILSPNSRAELIRKAARKHKISEQQIYNLLRRYWQRGQTKNALIPDFFRCGGRGKFRIFTDKKPGKKSDALIRRNISTGVVLNKHWHEIIVQGGRMFYERVKGCTMSEAYRKTLHHFCPLRDETGKIILPQAEKGEVFTYDQFRYHYLKDANANLERFLKKRYGKRTFNVFKRPRTGTARDGLYGPCSLYQIDATIADIYLVNFLDRTIIIGRPVIYAVVDPWSGYIVGIAVTLESEKWSGYCLSLLNVVEDKVSFCREYGVEIEPEMWINTPFSSQILGDRSSMESRFANVLAEAFGIQVSNTAPYRPDWKGYIEQIFRLMNIRVIHILPGAVVKNPEPGDRDYRLNACLDLHEFTRIIIKMAIHHNNDHRLVNLKRDADMIADKVEPYPIDLLWWGMENRPSSTRYFTREEAQLHLLPQAEARVTSKGIEYRNLTYICDLANQENWMLRANEKGTWKIDIGYDPRSVNSIYLRFKDGRHPVECRLKDDNSPFKNLDWETVDSYFAEKKLDDYFAKGRRRQSDIELELDVTETFRKAQKETKQARERAGKISKAAQTKGIRENKRRAIRENNLRESAKINGSPQPEENNYQGDSYTHISVPHPAFYSTGSDKTDN